MRLKSWLKECLLLYTAPLLALAGAAIWDEYEIIKDSSPDDRDDGE